jgi:hypothetical protein
LPVQVLLNVVVNLRGTLRWKCLNELIDWFDPALVAIVDRLR